MLSKKFRLSRKDFLVAKSQGKSYSFPFFSVVTSPNTLGFNRFAIVTSKKLHKHAVVRNRLRRQIYDLVKSFPGSSDIILFPKQSTLTMSQEALAFELKKVMSLSSIEERD